MTSATSGWQGLTTESRSKCPKLFYSLTTLDDGYDLSFTDLISLWTARATREEVLHYAHITRASIDPTESKSQFRVLLQKLDQSLSTGKNNLRQDESSDSEAILLQTELELPKPLQPLKWTFQLKSQSSGEMAERIMRPCLHAASEGQRKLEYLCGVIAAKDHVISRLLEKIEGSATDLSLIFPGITGARVRKGQVTVKDAKKRVPGLAEFNRDDWLRSFVSDGSYTSFETEGLGRLVGGLEKCPKHTPDQHERWLQKLPKASATTSQVVRAQLNRSSPMPAGSDTDSSDEFETQKKRRPGSTKNNATNNDSDSSGEDRIVKNARRAITSPALASTSLNSKPRDRSSSPRLPPTPRPQETGDVSSTVTDPSSDLDARPKAKRRLGQLGHKPMPVATLLTRSSTRTEVPPSSSPHLRPISTIPSSSPLSLSGPNSGNQNRSVSPSSGVASRKPSIPRKLGQSGDSKSSTKAVTPERTGDGNSSTQHTPSHRLGRLGSSRQATQSATPEHKKSEKPSTQTTTSRRLGRLGTSLSQDTSQSQLARKTSSMYVDKDNDLDPIREDEGNNSDISTASSASTISPKPKNRGGSSAGSPSVRPQLTRAARDGASTTSQAQHRLFTPPSNNEVDKEEPEEQLTKEEKANRKRDELKRKIDTLSDSGPAAGIGKGIGTRKKRKF